MEASTIADDSQKDPDVADSCVDDDSSTDESASLGEHLKKGRSRKRARDPSQWKANVRKRLCQEGKPYLSVRKKMVTGREIKNLKNCHTSCRFKCMENISQEDRVQIHDAYYQLNQNRKYDFIATTTSYGKTDRPTGKGPSRRKKSIRYFFFLSEKKMRVCKPYYLGTLCISQKVIYNVHEKKDKTGTPKADGRGKHAKKVTHEEVVQGVKNHILSFPAVESHYCRAKTEKRYLESNLNVTKMYDLYVEKCNVDKTAAVKLSFYRHTFNSMIPALDFHKPKSDRCDKCEIYDTAKNNNLLTDTLQQSHQSHVNEKEAMREER
ncbi:uncharacterized protein LOC135469966 [Liolophura sinensis]|uniref:uncharacterized protein LOC135469966 n=1 Tax=Liolophura sinensis TaxID=3198878 RepID=UPI003158AAE5